MASDHSLQTTLADGAYLVNTPPHEGPADLKTILLLRLSKYLEHVNPAQIVDESMSLEYIEFLTAREALSVLGRVQGVLEQQVQSSDNADIPIIGTRDLGQLRTLLSIVFKWGTNPTITSITSLWPKKQVASGSLHVDPRTVEDYETIVDVATRLMALIFPTGLYGTPSQTLITATIYNRHLGDVLRPSILVGWLSKGSLGSVSPADDVRLMTMRLLSMLPPAQTITSLGQVLSSAPQLPLYAHKSCSSLLSRQVLRPEGVQGLCIATFGEGDSQADDAPPEKIEQVSRVLTTVPRATKPEDYFATIIPRVIDLLSEETPPMHRRAAAFTISKLLVADSDRSHHTLTSTLILTWFHSPFLAIPMTEANASSTDGGPSAVLSKLIILLSNMDPSPSIITDLLSPIFPALFSLDLHLECVKTSDPSTRESLHTSLLAWGRIVNIAEGIGVFKRILAGERGFWELDLEHGIRRVGRPKEPLLPTALLTPKDSLDLDVSSNILNLYPDPAHFVHFLADINRADISSELFVILLEGYRDRKSQPESDPLETLLYLQIIMQMQSELGRGDTSSNILCKPTHILHFIKHVLESTVAKGIPEPLPVPISTHPVAIINPVAPDDLSDDGDSDDDTPGAQTISPEDDMLETSLNLLLSILEANEELSARTAPILNNIFSLLESIPTTVPLSVQELIREARIVMTARIASGIAPRRSNQQDGTQVTYQKALKLLQDPILPVRAHGLMLLKQLVLPRRKTEHLGQNEPLDPAFIPAILSIFTQSIQDDDSYIFLNAVQGLAAMVDAFGREVFSTLVAKYAEGLEGHNASTLTQHDVDVKIRIGEALSSSIKRCGSALGLYVDLIVPKVYQIIRANDIPTTIRSSSFSLLADCEVTYPLAMYPYIADLSTLVLDLLQVESIPSNSSQGGEPLSAEAEATSSNSKLPPLRRSALHFLSLTIREVIRSVGESSFESSVLPPALFARAKTILGYIAFTDQDIIIRTMAREADENLVQLQREQLGIYDDVSTSYLSQTQ